MLIKHRFFNKKIGAFFVCLLIASILWIVHALNVNYKYTLTVPVRFLNLPSNKLIVGELPDKLDIVIKTSGLKLALISIKGINSELEIDFNTVKTNAKSQAYAISNGHLNLKSVINFDVDVVKIRPDTLFFSLNKGANKLVPVKLNLMVSYNKGYAMVSKPIINPAFVIITGDSTELEKIDTIYTQTVTLKNITQNYLGVALLKKTNSAVNYNMKEVSFNFNVDRFIETSMKIPITILGTKTDAQIKLLPNFITTKYLVATNDFNTINANSFKATVNYSDIEKNEKMLQVKLTISPSEVKILNNYPSHVSYLIYK